jgi:excisionase family DNA binding protein
MSDAKQRDGLTTVRKAADYLGLSRAAVYRLMDRGDLPYAKLGYARRVRWADVEAYVEASMVRRDG